MVKKKIAIIARMDHSGLGHQTRDLVRAIEPDKVVLIDFTFHNSFKQYPKWYKDYNTTTIQGFMSDADVTKLCQEVDVVLTAETFYNNRFVEIANRNNVVTLSQVNYEFFDPLRNRNILIPSRILMPSYWHLEDMKKLAPAGKVMYLPPPTFVGDFDEVREHNYNRTGKKRFLHVAGNIAIHDRAGTLDLVESLKQSKADFELVIKVQKGILPQINDPRVTLDDSFPEDERDLYKGFDAMIQPRRYAGLNLPMNEALSAGLPVIMTRISPNNKVLPNDWLVLAQNRGSFVARTKVDVFSAAHSDLASRIDQFASLDEDKLKEYKKQAHSIALKEYSPETFKEKWALLMRNIGV